MNFVIQFAFLLHTLLLITTIKSMHIRYAHTNTIFLNNSSAEENHLTYALNHTVVDDTITIDTYTLNTRFLKSAYSTSTLIIIAPGYNGDIDSFNFLHNHFPYYDILKFDFRWKNSCCSFDSIIHPIEHRLDNCINDIEKIINHFCTQKNYQHIIGFGFCYGCYLLTGLQAKTNTDNKPLFTKLILDSCPTSLHSFTCNALLDPGLSCDYAHGGAPDALTQILHLSCIQTCLTTFMHNILPAITIIPFLKTITNTPILFIHGKRDLLITLNDFETLWNAAQSNNPIAYLTEYEHICNIDNKHIPHVSMYSYLCRTFIESKNTETCLHNLTH